MDTSEAFIKQCDCPEIQEHIPQNYDFYWNPEFNVLGVYLKDRSGGRYWSDTVSYGGGVNESDIWLPRQDQLQEMLDFEHYDSPLYPFIDFCTEPAWYKAHSAFEYIETFTSMEQLWLAFVMKEKFNKVWCNDKWEELCLPVIENPDFEEEERK